ncbi:helicase MOV-10 isoform X2 [Scaptodrosophila lebanonensis]|uniref:Helicase MOV-10 isoform X2 n=1 Tax=Drosophila lebanonensis TaxID=7225 RepID=A0A6J2U1R4_DROLE|nr:helicase MOV-10 isoform X2 [Scaptodrosophila lebanonensis]
MDLSDPNNKLDEATMVDEEEAQQEKLLSIMCSLPQYEPSLEMRKALWKNFTSKSLSNNNEVIAKYLQDQQLDCNNFAAVQRTLLNIEDLSTMYLYTQLMQTDVKLVRTSKFQFNFPLRNSHINAEDVLTPNMDEVVIIPKASLLASPPLSDVLLTLFPHPHEHLKSTDPMCRHVAIVEKVSRTLIQIKFKRGSGLRDCQLGQYFDVIIRSRRLPLRYMYRAVELLDEWPELRLYLFPGQKLKPLLSASNRAVTIDLFNGSIASNSEQLQAVQQIVTGPNAMAPYIVFGPPGTGKTTTIVEAILQLRLQQPRSRILVTAGSNSACDTIALLICEFFAVNVRLRAHIAKRSMESRLVTMDVKPTHQLIRLFSRSSYGKGLKSVNPLLRKHSNCPGKTFETIDVDDLRQYGIIVATLCTVGRLITDNLGKFNFFTHVFVDEAGASTEPESLIGIMGIKQQADCHVILSGDHKQLGAVIKSDRAASLGLGNSLMERLLRSPCYALDGNGNYDHTIQTRLRRNYRSHPQIVRLYNELYYNNELLADAQPADVNMAAKWSLLQNGDFPIIFQATHGVTEREQHSTSTINTLEVKVLKWYVQRLFLNGIKGACVQQKDIGIIAPYAAQVRLLKESMIKLGYHDIEVGCVEAYQGREKPIILVSLVRSFFNLGFLRNPRRLNVMLSRAKSLLIIIGNPVTLRHHRDFKFIINECKKHGNYLYKKKDVDLWQKRLLNYEELSDVEDESESEFDDNEEEPELKEHPWCAKMPDDIPVTVTTIEKGSGSMGAAEDDSSSECSSSSSISSGTVSSTDSNIETTTTEKIIISTPFLKACAVAPNSTRKILQIVDSK